MDWVTTTDILQRLGSEDDQAWQLFTERFRPAVRGFARRMGLDEDESEDVAQESLLAFVQAYRDGRYLREKGRLRSWLFGIARMTALKRARRPRREVVRESDQESFWGNLEDEARAEETFQQAWREVALSNALGKVREEVEERTFSAFQRFVFGREPAATVAADLGLSENAVFLTKHRLLKRIRSLCESFEHIAE